MNPEEMTALILEDASKFEQLTNIHLTEDDLRIISMNRFASLERSMNRLLTESEYSHLLQTNPPFDYIEQELLKRSLSPEERIEQEELFAIKNLEKQNIELTHAQLNQVNRISC